MKLNLYFVFSWQDAAAAIDNMVWPGIFTLTEVGFDGTEGSLVIYWFAEPPKLQGCMGSKNCHHMKIFTVNQSLARLTLTHMSVPINNINTNHPYWLTSHRLLRVQGNKLQTLWNLHSEVAYFAKEAGFHEALDQLTIDPRNSIRIMTGCATNANDLNVLERSLGKWWDSWVSVPSEILVLLMSDMQHKGVLSYCGLEFCGKIYCKLTSTQCICVLQICA